MSTLSAITRRELGALFQSPMAWIIAAVMQVVFAYLFLLTLEDYIGVQATLALQDHAPGVTAFMAFRYLAPASTLLLIICPLLSMRVFADEYRLQTFALLRSSPVSASTMVLGKFLGVFLFVCLLSILMVSMPLSLIALSGIDVATLALAWLGILCLAASATAVGIYFSSLTRHSMVAAISSIATLLFLWIIGKGTFSNAWVVEALSASALSAHLAQFFQGVLDTREIGYFVVLTALFLLLTIVRIDSQQHVAAH